MILNNDFHSAVSNNNTEIVKLLLSNEKIDVNIPCVLNHYISLYNISFNKL